MKEKRQFSEQECNYAIARINQQVPDLALQQDRIVQLAESIHPDDEESPEEYLARLYGLAKADHIALQKENQALLLEKKSPKAAPNYNYAYTVAPTPGPPEALRVEERKGRKICLKKMG